MTQFRIYFYNGLHGLYGFFVARGDDGRMQNNPNGRSRRGSKIRIIRAIRCGKTLPKLKSKSIIEERYGEYTTT